MKLSVEIISDFHGVLTVAIGLRGKLISVIAGDSDEVFNALTRLFEKVQTSQ